MTDPAKPQSAKSPEELRAELGALRAELTQALNSQAA